MIPRRKNGRSAWKNSRNGMSSDPFPDLDSEESAALLDTLVQEHAERSAERVLERLGGPLTEDTLDQFLNDDACIRYPAEIVFDGTGLESNQFGEPFMLDEGEQRTCKLHIHPKFSARRDLLPYFVGYLTPLVNYGPIVSSEICEQFGAEVTGMDREEYYALLCDAVDSA